MVQIPRVRMGEKQEIETLISEEAFLFSQYVGNERKDWNPRIANLDFNVDRQDFSLR
jgi:hypothetical protein